MKRITRVLLTCLFISFAACTEKENTETTDAKAPEFLSCSPEDGAEGLGYEGEQSLNLTYDQNIKCSLADQKLVSIDNGASIVKVTASGTNLNIRVTDLKSSSSYTVTVPEGIIKGFKSNQQGAKQVSIHFSTKDAPLPPVPDNQIPEPEDNDAWALMEKLALGWNMGNHFDSFFNGTWAGDRFLWPDETCWGNPKCTRATFTKLKAAGFETVRIPITWLKTINFDTFEIDKQWMDRIKEVVLWARDAGLNVIINTHHDEDHYIGSESMGHRWLNIMDAVKDSALNEEIKRQIAGVWTSIANEFKNEGDYLIFEGFNEINDGKWGGSSNTPQQCAILNQWNQTFVDAVRASGGNNATRWIATPTYCASPSYAKYYTHPTDPAGRTILAVHCYDPYNFTLAEGLPQKKWGHTMGNSWDEKNVRDVISALYSNYVAKGIPVYMGEFGCSFREYGTAEWKCEKYYLEYFVKCCRTFGIPAFVWDNGNPGAGAEHHAYIDHGTGDYVGHSEELVKIMVKAMTNKDETYTLDSVYENAPS